MWLLANWKALVASFLTAAIAYGAHFIDVTILEKRQKTELTDLRTQLGTACNKAQELTKETYDELLGNCQTAANQCAAALKLPSTCIPVRDTPEPNKLASARPRHDDTGIASNWLRSYETECKSLQSDYHTCVKHDNSCTAWAN